MCLFIETVFQLDVNDIFLLSLASCNRQVTIFCVPLEELMRTAQNLIPEKPNKDHINR